MQNINVFGPVVHEKKIFKYLSISFHFLPLKGQPLYLNKSESPKSITDAFCQVWLKLAHWLLRRCFHEKVDRQTLHHAVSSVGFRPGKLIIAQKGL